MRRFLESPSGKYRYTGQNAPVAIEGVGGAKCAIRFREAPWTPVTEPGSAWGGRNGETRGGRPGAGRRSGVACRVRVLDLRHLDKARRDRETARPRTD